MDFTTTKILFSNNNLTLTSVYDHFTYKKSYIIQTEIFGQFKNDLLNKLKLINNDIDAIKLTIDFINERSKTKCGKQEQIL